MGTGVDHLFRRGSVYWWQRRLPLALASISPRRVARSLRTKDFELARRRARACSVWFDLAIIQLMKKGAAPTRQDLSLLLDDIFRRILEDGERTRAQRDPGYAPPWIPDPETDLL